jgi:signal peptidase I
MKALRIIKNIVLDVIIVFLVLAIIVGHLNKTKPVPFFNYYFFTVLTGSMQNTLYPGDNIIVKKQNDYKVGDIVTYHIDDVYVTHRITKIEGNNVTTKGDANTTEDPPFEKKDILGKFVYKSDLLNFIVRNKIIVILVVIIIYLLEGIIKKSNEKVVDDAS